MLKVTTFLNESSPALTIATRCLYVGIGVEPVGRPSTKGFEAVGANARMRSFTRPATNSPHSGAPGNALSQRLQKHVMTAPKSGLVLTGRIVAHNELHGAVLLRAGGCLSSCCRTCVLTCRSARPYVSELPVPPVPRCRAGAAESAQSSRQSIEGVAGLLSIHIRHLHVGLLEL